MSPARIESFTVGKAAALVGLDRWVLYEAIKDGSLKTWRPHARGEMRINLDELRRWAGYAVETKTSAA